MGHCILIYHSYLPEERNADFGLKLCRFSPFSHIQYHCQSLGEGKMSIQKGQWLVLTSNRVGVGVIIRSEE